MLRLDKFAALSWRDKVLFIRTLGAVSLFAAALAVLRYQSVRKLLPARLRRRAQRDNIATILKFVPAAARLAPGATCLPQALAAQSLLARAGYETQVRIGVAPDQSKALVAHAWVVRDGAVIFGGSPELIGRYRTLTDLGLSSS